MSRQTHPVTASAEVKSLRKRIKQAGVRIGELVDEKGKIQKRIREKNNEVRKLKGRLKELEGVELEVTDHAILRYLQRVDGLDVDGVKATMLTDDLRKQVDTLGGTGKFPGPNGTRLVMENKRIISVIPS